MEKEEKLLIVRLSLAAVLFGISFLPFGEIYSYIVCGVAYLIIGYDVIFGAFKNLFRGKPLDEEFLMTVASVGAMAIKEFHEAVAVMFFYQFGEFLQDLAVDRSRSAIADVMNIRPDHANIEVDGEIVSVPPESVEKGTIIIVKPGEKIPIDGVIEEGFSTLDTAAMTGESMPREVAVGDSVIGGFVNISGLLRVRTTGVFGESAVAKILELVEKAETGKAKSEKFIGSFAKIYTPVVVILALLIAVVPSLIFGDWGGWIHRALVFLVISCPCALVISVPLGFFGGIGGASRNGILVKSSETLEVLSKLGTVVFDKTGTLTEGKFGVAEIRAHGVDDDELLRIAATAESFSDHPIARSIVEKYGKEIDRSQIESYDNIVGRGVIAVIDDCRVAVGNARLMSDEGIIVKAPDGVGTVVYVAADGVFLGSILIADKIKPSSADAVSELKREGVRSIVMLSGDRPDVCLEVSKKVGIDDAFSELLPDEKVTKLTEFIGREGYGKVAFVGDGINDAPVIKIADVGVSMGKIGSDAAVEAADVVIMDDDPKKVVKAIKVAKRTMRIVKENIIISLAIKFAVLAVSVFGLPQMMWLAAFSDVGALIISVINSLRALKK